MRVNTRYINSISDASSKKDAPQWHIYPTFRAHSETQVCTGIRQNQFLFKTGHGPLISNLVQHFNEMSVHGWWKRVSVHGWWKRVSVYDWWKRVSCQSMIGGKECPVSPWLVEKSVSLWLVEKSVLSVHGWWKRVSVHVGGRESSFIHLFFRPLFLPASTLSLSPCFFSFFLFSFLFFVCFCLFVDFCYLVLFCCLFLPFLSSFLCSIWLTRRWKQRSMFLLLLLLLLLTFPPGVVLCDRKDDKIQNQPTHSANSDRT